MSIDLGGQLYSKALEAYKELAPLFLQEYNWVHCDQFARSLGSTVANIAEGNGRKQNSKKYYQNFLLISRGSLYETLAWLDCFKVLYHEKTYDVSVGTRLLCELEKELTKEIIRTLE